MRWTEELDAEATEHWSNGLSASETAREMNLQSRCAVVGRWYRLGLTGRWPTVVKKRERRTRPRVKGRKARPAVKAVTYNGEPPSLDLPLSDLTNDTCRWPHGEGPYTFCGHAVKEGASYCPFHHGVSRTSGTQRDFDRLAKRTLGGTGGLRLNKAGIL